MPRRLPGPECPAIFLVGCHRSGTTLMRRLLDQHPSLCCPPESKFLAALEGVLRYPQAMTALASLGSSPSSLMTALSVFARDVFRAYAAAAGKPRWIDKTPNYYRILPFIDTLFGEGTRYIFIVRHPLDVIQSLQETPAFGMTCPEDPEIASAIVRFGRGAEAWAAYWLEVNSYLSAFASNHSDRAIVVKYEDLCVNAQAVLRLVLEFLGEEWAPDLVKKAFSATEVPGYGDWKIRRATEVYTTSVGRWYAWKRSDIEAAWAVSGELAQELGYEIDVPGIATRESSRP